LATAPENEEDFDAFNSETFADEYGFYNLKTIVVQIFFIHKTNNLRLIDGEGEWEDEHDKLIALEDEEEDGGAGDRTLNDDDNGLSDELAVKGNNRNGRSTNGNQLPDFFQTNNGATAPSGKQSILNTLPMPVSRIELIDTF
jgi:hypothetical protein